METWRLVADAAGLLAGRIAFIARHDTLAALQGRTSKAGHETVAATPGEASGRSWQNRHLRGEMLTEYSSGISGKLRDVRIPTSVVYGVKSFPRGPMRMKDSHLRQTVQPRFARYSGLFV